jgi:hypothetical protein
MDPFETSKLTRYTPRATIFAKESTLSEVLVPTLTKYSPRESVLLNHRPILCFFTLDSGVESFPHGLQSNTQVPTITIEPIYNRYQYNNKDIKSNK